MTKFTVYAAATFALVGLSVPAIADINGGPVKNGGQCWSNSVLQNGSNGSTWGYWGSCPKTASTAPAGTPRLVRHRRHAAR
jgi:hypothetical protein